MVTKIQLLHPAGKKAVSMASAKYDLLKKEIMKALKDNGSCSHKELMEHVAAMVPVFDGAIGWHTEWVKLDLEARKEIIRTRENAQERYSLPRT